jgi:hypothetical protein
MAPVTSRQGGGGVNAAGAHKEQFLCINRTVS